MIALKEVGIGMRRAIAVSMLIPRCTVSYIGAGTGSLIIQVVIAGLAGALIALKVYWRQIKAFFTGRKEKAGEAEPAGAVADPAEVADLLPAQAVETLEGDTD